MRRMLREFGLDLVQPLLVRVEQQPPEPVRTARDAPPGRGLAVGPEQVGSGDRGLVAEG